MRSILEKLQWKMKIGLCGVEGFHTEFVGFHWVLSSGNCMCFLQGNCVFVCWKNYVFALEKLCVCVGKSVCVADGNLCVLCWNFVCFCWEILCGCAVKLCVLWLGFGWRIWFLIGVPCSAANCDVAAEAVMAANQSSWISRRESVLANQSSRISGRKSVLAN